jgi:hypothetical protein
MLAEKLKLYQRHSRVLSLLRKLLLSAYTVSKLIFMA